MTVRQQAAIVAWKPAPEGATWQQLDAAWWALLLSLEAAEARDRKDLS